MAQPSLKTEAIALVDHAKHAAVDSLASGLDAVRNEAGRIETVASQGATELADQVSKGIKSAGAEADVLIDAAKDQATALQKLLADELRVHPMRTLCIAAVAGLLVGYVSSR